jgi:hypothetical protein
MSQSAIADQSDRYMKELAHKVAEQEAYVRRMIVRGVPSQAAEDRLSQLQHQLSRLRERIRIQDR